MSTDSTMATGTEEQIERGDPDPDRLAQVERRLADLEATNEELREAVSEREERIAELEQTVDELDHKVSVRNENRFEVISHVLFGTPEDKPTYLYDDQQEFVEEHGGVLPQLQDVGGLDALKASLSERIDSATQQIAKVRRRITLVAEDQDVDISDSRLAGDDTIKNVLKFGVAEALDKSPTKAEYRAEELLQWAGEIGDTTRDKFGERITIQSAEARRCLERERDESLQSNQVWRVFQKVEEWADDSPRTVNAKRGGHGDENTLAVYLQYEDE